LGKTPLKWGFTQDVILFKGIFEHFEGQTHFSSILLFKAHFEHFE
jgi:hypothetical protein